MVNMSLLRKFLFKNSIVRISFYQPIGRFISSQDDRSRGEEKLSSILRNRFPKAQVIDVQDISGGCGAMYAVSVITSEFKGKNILNQHRMVTEALKAEVKDMHGIRIHTEVGQNST